MSDCEELSGAIIVIKAVSSKAIELIYGSKGAMSYGKRKARTARKSR